MKVVREPGPTRQYGTTRATVFSVNENFLQVGKLNFGCRLISLVAIVEPKEAKNNNLNKKGTAIKHSLTTPWSPSYADITN